MNSAFSRTEMLFGEEAMEKLYNAKVAVFGVGGVGGHCTEALCRSGIGTIDIIDNDIICESNLNRQIIATTKTLGMYKADAMRERILEINPKAKVTAYKLFYLPETADSINLSKYDYIIDAIDTMTAKLELICRAKALDIPIISSMGAANKINPTAFEIGDIYETSICPVARVMRRELRKRSVKSLKTVFSKEPPIKLITSQFPPVREDSAEPEYGRNRRIIPASNAFVPAAAGLIIAGEVVGDIIGDNI